ncbi:MAG: hypothetical protein ACK5OA_04190 [Acidovorax sp.]|jgi:hypothetical protein
MQMLLSVWPFLVWALPVLVLLSAIVFLAKGNRGAFWQLLALLACFVIAALLMELFTFMASRMANGGKAGADPALGSGTRQLLAAIAATGSVLAKPLSLPWLAACSVPVAYLWLLVTWALHLRRGKSGGGRAARKKATRA